jgi:hypothetical protein
MIANQGEIADFVVLLLPSKRSEYTQIERERERRNMHCKSVTCTR